MVGAGSGAGATTAGASTTGGAGSTRTGVGGSSTTALCGAASMASSNGEDSIASPLSDGSAATGVCHWKASSRPLTGDTGRQRSLT